MESALQQTKVVKQKVETVAIDLDATNQQVRTRLAAGRGTIPAPQALAAGERLQSAVEEAAADLVVVDSALSEGIDHLGQTEQTLADTQRALAISEKDVDLARQESEIAQQRALHDPMTGLPNRELYNDRLTQAIALADRHAWTLAVLFVDLDGFKLVNDTHGHAAGDRVLQEIAQRLARQSRAEDTVCRYGGDEFLLLMVNPQGRENVERFARIISDRIAQPIALDGAEVRLGSSIGISFYPEHGRTGEQLVGHADAAMYRAKRQGGGHGS